MVNEHLLAVEKLLAGILTAVAAHDTAAGKAAAEIEKVKSKHAAGIAAAKKRITKLEKDLDRLVRSHRAEILGDGDRADLPNGSVMLKDEKRVRRIKGMLERLKAAGLNNAVRTLKEAVDWDRVERFNDGMLARLGTERVVRANFSYELKDAAK